MCSPSVAVENPTLEKAQRLQSEGDYEQALAVVSRLLELEPLQPVATRLSHQCRAALAREYLAAVGSENAVPVLGVSSEELARFSVDNISAFLLKRIDGVASVQEVLDVAGLPPLLALRHLRKLVERGLVCVVSDPRRPSAPHRAGSRSGPEPTDNSDSSTVEIGALPSRRPGPTLSAIPVLLVGRDDIARCSLDPQARTLIALVNDQASVEEILATTQTDLVSGVTLFEQLADHGLVAFV